MNRDEFMNRVEYLLSDLPEEEKTDALDYYRGYLDEAGDAEEEVLREFGSPERIASIIRSDLQGGLADGGEFTDTGYTDERFKEPGYRLARREQEAERKTGYAGEGSASAGSYRTQNTEGSGMNPGQDTRGARGTYQGEPGAYNGAGSAGGYGSTGAAGGYGAGGNGGTGGYGSAGGGAGGNGGAGGRAGSNLATKVLWIILAVILASAVLPSLLGFAGGAVGVLVAVLAVLCVFVFLTAILTLVFLIAGAAVIIAGIAAAFVNPVDGLMCVGVGLIMLAMGLIGIVLSVLLYGRFLPWLIRGAGDGLNSMLHRRRRTA